MPSAKWDEVPDANDFSPIPSGEYPVECTKVDQRTSRNTGREYYNIEFTIVGGEYDGRKVWDAISFEGDTEEKTKFALQRVKLVAHRLGGMKLTGDSNFDPRVLVGKQWYVTVIKTQRKDHNGIMQEVNQIPFAGYRERDDDDVPTPDLIPIDPKDDLPF